MRIVLALGGNALGNNASEQKTIVKETVKAIADLIEDKNEVIIVHGNGPQVGMINNAFTYASEGKVIDGSMPFAECGAMSQGYIGYHLQNALKVELLKRGISKEVTTLITQVIVDENDKAFSNPTKPIGPFLRQEEALELEKTRGYKVKEDSGRGYRRVVASPLPVDFIETKTIELLVKNCAVPICVGGGGIPVVARNGEYEGIDAVVDKDFAASKLAELLSADCLFILTAVKEVMLNYNTPKQVALRELNVADAEKYIAEKQFGEGSMLPKIKACLSFVKNNNKGIALISALSEAKEALKGNVGTKIVKE